MKLKTFRVPWLPFGFDGMALRWVILLKNEDKGLLEHELIHIEQQKKHGFIKYMLLWFFNDYAGEPCLKPRLSSMARDTTMKGSS